MKFRAILRSLMVVATVAAGSLVVTAAPAAAATYRTQPIYSVVSREAGTPRAMAVLNASTANTQPLVHAPFTSVAPHNDIMVLEIEPGNIGRIKPRHTFSDDGNPHNDKCLAILNNDNLRYQPIVNATCTYDNVNNDVWEIETFYTTGGAQFRYKSVGLNWCIKAQNPRANDRLVTDLCGASGTYWAY